MCLGLCSRSGDVLESFHAIFFHVMVRDKEGRKMSKNLLATSLIPLEVINGCSLQALQDRVR